MIISSLQITTDLLAWKISQQCGWFVQWRSRDPGWNSCWRGNNLILSVGKSFICQRTAENWDKISNIRSGKNENHQTLGQSSSIHCNFSMKFKFDFGVI